MSDLTTDVNAVAVRLAGKEIVGAELRWYGSIPDELRLRFYGGEELHINGVFFQGGDDAGLSLDLIPNREDDK